MMIDMVEMNDFVHNLTLEILIWRHYDVIISESGLYTMKNV